MSIRSAGLAALLAALGSACTARHLVRPGPAPSGTAYETGDTALQIRSFDVTAAAGEKDEKTDLAALKTSFAEYLSSRCKFSRVEYGAGPGLNVDVKLKAEHSSNRTWILDIIAADPGFGVLWPFTPQWGTARVEVTLASAEPPGVSPVTMKTEGAADYSMTVYSWYRTEPVEEAYRAAYRDAFARLANDFCSTGRVQAMSQSSRGVAIPAAAPALAPQQRAVVPAAVSISAGKVAVLDFKNYAKDLQKENVQYFTDLVRGVVLKGAPRFNVMTRENLLVLLQASGKDLASCEGECEVDTGRRIGADVIVRMHETRDGRLISTAIASGASVDLLDDAATKAADELVAPIR